MSIEAPAYPTGSNFPIPMAPAPEGIGDLSHEIAHKPSRRIITGGAAVATLVTALSGVPAQASGILVNAGADPLACPPLTTAETGPIITTADLPPAAEITIYIGGGVVVTIPNPALTTTTNADAVASTDGTNAADASKSNKKNKDCAPAEELPTNANEILDRISVDDALVLEKKKNLTPVSDKELISAINNLYLNDTFKAELNAYEIPYSYGDRLTKRNLNGGIKSLLNKKAFPDVRIPGAGGPMSTLLIFYDNTTDQAIKRPVYDLVLLINRYGKTRIEPTSSYSKKGIFEGINEWASTNLHFFQTGQQ